MDSQANTRGQQGSLPAGQDRRVHVPSVRLCSLAVLAFSKPEAQRALLPPHAKRTQPAGEKVQKREEVQRGTLHRGTHRLRGTRDRGQVGAQVSWQEGSTAGTARGGRGPEEGGTVGTARGGHGPGSSCCRAPTLLRRMLILPPLALHLSEAMPAAPGIRSASFRSPQCSLASL